MPRVRDVPTRWEARHHDAGAGQLFTTLAPAGGTGAGASHTRPAVPSDLGAGLVSDIEGG